MKLGRNDPCHCGSGNKYKKCCLKADEAARSAEIAKEAADRAASEAVEDAAPQGSAPKGPQPAGGGVQRPKGPPPKGPAPLRRRAV